MPVVNALPNNIPSKLNAGFVGWGGLSTNLGPGRHGEMLSCWFGEGVFLAYLAANFLGARTCMHCGVVCLFLTSAVLNAYWVNLT